MQYAVKAVIFDIIEDCTGLKKQLCEEGIITIVPFFGLHIEETLRGIVKGTSLKLEECLMLTNDEQHAKIAKQLGIAVAGCVEGHFGVPQGVTLLEEPKEVSVTYLNQVYCHEKGIPAVIAETKRCRIKEMTENDIDALYKILTQEEVAKFLPAKSGNKKEELEKLSAYIENVYSFFGYGYWGVFDKYTGRLIGRAGFKEGSYPLEIGYLLDSACWGKGLASELVTELLEYAKRELLEENGCIIAKVDTENKASQRVLEKCGFRGCDVSENIKGYVIGPGNPESLFVKQTEE